MKTDWLKMAAISSLALGMCLAESTNPALPASSASDETTAGTNDAPASVSFTNEIAQAETTGGTRTEITSKQLRMDTENKIAYFDGDVLVLDPQFELRATRLIVHLNPSGSGMSHAEAYDDVVIVQDSEKRRAYCQKAVYTTADGKIELTGSPRLENEKGTTTGEKITIFRQNNTILIEGGTRTTIDLTAPSPAATNLAPEDTSSTTNAPPESDSN